MLASRLADAVTTACWGIGQHRNIRRALSRLWDRVTVLEDGQDALAEVVTETTAELVALHRAVEALQLRADTAEREAGERAAALESACQARLRHAMHEMTAQVGLRETT